MVMRLIIGEYQPIKIFYLQPLISPRAYIYLRILSISHTQMSLWRTIQEELDAKASTGSSQSPTMTGPPVYRKTSLGSEDNWNEAQTQSTYTGKYAWPRARNYLWDKSNDSLVTPHMANSADQKPQPTMSGKKTPESKEPNLKWEQDPSNATPPRTGTPSGMLQHGETSYPSRLTYVFCITKLSEQSALTLRNQLEWSELVMYTSVQLELESQGGPGTWQDWTLTVRIPTQNSGAVIPVRELLLSMNFVVESMSHTSYVGLTVIQLTWKSKDQVYHYIATPFSSPPTWTLNNGIQNLMNQL